MPRKSSTPPAPVRPKAKTPSRHAAIKRRVRAARAPHVRFALHPLSIFMLLVTGVLITGWTLHSAADSYTVTATVPAPSLTEGAAITSPANGTKTTTDSVTVEGTCPDNSYVTLTRNNLFSGVAACAVDNTFTIVTSLSLGDNQLVAQDFNITDEAGPSTPGIIVQYQQPDTGGGGDNSGGSSSGGSTSGGSSSSSGDSTPALPLLLASAYRFQAVSSGSAFQWVIDVKGGTSPYSLSVDWGDGNQTAQTADHAGDVTINHDYFTPGYFTILVTTTDAKDVATTLQLVAFVRSAGTSGVLFQSGNPSVPGSTGNMLLDTLTASKWLLVAWPSYAVVSLMVASFWLGERQQIRRLFAFHHATLRPHHSKH